MRKLTSFAVITSLIIPLSALALEGQGRRVTLNGVVLSVQYTDMQRFDKVGGTVTLEATNGQRVKVNLLSTTTYLVEGRSSRSSRSRITSADVKTGMLIRVSGVRKGTDEVDASLLTFLGIDKSPELSVAGRLQSIGPDNITVLLVNGQAKIYTLTAETEVTVDYMQNGIQALTLYNKYVQLTLNPRNPLQIKLMRVNARQANALNDL